MTRRIAFVGNPNVGKSTIFNTLTGLHQHTGNWSGVTVSCTRGRFLAGDHDFLALDLPGVYSFDVRSGEEAVTRDYVETQAYEYLLLICDCTCLERGLHLLKQTCDLISGTSLKCPKSSSVQTSATRQPEKAFILILRLWKRLCGSRW